MKKISLRAVMGEFVGSAVLVAVVVGSGFMGDALSGDDGVALLINAVSTMLALALLIVVIGPISGAHFNPAVTLVMVWAKTIRFPVASAYILAQISGSVVGAITANLMFIESWGTISSHHRLGIGTAIGEVIATAGLIAVIGILSRRGQQSVVPVAVAAWIGSAYFFTSSTSFANPAVTIGRVFTDSFSGIAPESVPAFIAAQLLGATIGAAVVHLTTHTESREK